MKLDISTLEFKLKDVTDSAIGDISVSLVNTIFGLFEGVIKSMINLIFSRGLSMQWLLDYLHLNFVKLDDSVLKPYDGYFVFYSTPTFNITSAIEHFNGHFVQSVQNVFENDEIIITQEDIDAISQIPLKDGKTIKDTLNEAVDQVNYQKEKDYMD